MSEKNNKYTPNLRFPEFTGEWKEVLVKDICDINTGKSNTQDQVADGLYPFFIRSATPVRSNRYLYDCEAVITIGDGQIGKVFHYVNGKFDLHQRCYMMSNFRGVDCRYFYHFFSNNFYDRAMRLSAKATVDSVRLEMISDMPIFIPPTPAEQRKIASCLSAMDDLIAAQAEKVEALKEKKMGLMQQLFPQPGETTPRLRFPEFTGEWEEKSINDCFEFKQGVQCPVDLQALQKRDGYIRFIRIIDLTQSGEPPRYIADPGLAHHICKEDLFMVRYGSPGLVGYGYEGVIANNLFRLLPKFDMCTKFFKDILTALHKNIAALCGIGALPAINFSTLGLLRISLPPTIAEQQKIADCLSALDDQIAAETEKLTALKEHKKGLMQQLFPQPAK